MMCVKGWAGLILAQARADVEMTQDEHQPPVTGSKLAV